MCELQSRPALVCEVQVRHVRADQVPIAGAVVGRAFRDRPAFERFFSPNPAKRSGAIGEVYAVILRQVAARGVVLGAYHDGRLVGVCGVTEPGHCQPCAMEKLAVCREVAAHASMAAALAFKQWRAGIASRDPEQPHWHIGPLAVEPGLQRLGLGTALVSEFLRMLDFSRELAFLDTDRRELMPFFARFGFREYSQAVVQGAPHWFLVRPRT